MNQFLAVIRIVCKEHKRPRSGGGSLAIQNDSSTKVANMVLVSLAVGRLRLGRLPCPMPAEGMSETYRLVLMIFSTTTSHSSPETHGNDIFRVIPPDS